MPKILFADGLGQYADVTDMGRRFLVANTGNSLASYTRTNGVTAKEYTGFFAGGLHVALTPSTTTQGAIMTRVRPVNISSERGLFDVRESDGTIHLTVSVLSSGAVQVRRGGIAGTVLATSAAAVLTTSVRYAVELKFTIHDSTGQVGVRVNEVEVLTFSGDTRNGGTAGTWAVVTFVNDGTSANVYVGDIHIADATGGYDYLGDLQTDPHYPNGAGNSTGGTPSAGSNFQCVDDNPSNGDTDYVSMTAAATRDTYAYENLKSPGASIRAVTVVIDAKKIDAGTARFKTATRRGGTDYLSTPEVSPSGGGYRYLDTGPMETDPSTSAAWTEANFNGAEFGFEKSA